MCARGDRNTNPDSAFISKSFLANGRFIQTPSLSAQSLKSFIIIAFAEQNKIQKRRMKNKGLVLDVDSGSIMIETSSLSLKSS
jgi:hypothetical protein